jgi:hypothetical protein
MYRTTYNNIILFYLFVFGRERDRHALRRGFFLACIRVGRIAILKHTIPDAQKRRRQRKFIRRPYKTKTTVFSPKKNDFF